MNEFNEYQKEAIKSKTCKGEDMIRFLADGTIISLESISFLSLGLSSESGNVAGKIKKLIRDYDYDSKIPLDKINDIKTDLSNMLWYLAVLAKEVGADMSDIVELSNSKKLKVKTVKEKEEDDIMEIPIKRHINMKFSKPEPLVDLIAHAKELGND